MREETPLVRQRILLRKLSARHHRATVQEVYDFYSYNLAYHRGSLYLSGVAPDHREIRHWKADRIEDAEATPVHFQRPEDFDLREHLAKSCGVFQGDGEVHVKVRFAASEARYVTESNWHSSQQLTPEKDSSLIAEFDLAHTEEIKRWIQSLGKDAVVLEPDSLRTEVMDEIEALRSEYAVDTPGVHTNGPKQSRSRTAMTDRYRRRDDQGRR